MEALLVGEAVSVGVALGEGEGEGAGVGVGTNAGLGVKVLLGNLPVTASLRQNAFMFRISAYSSTGSLLIKMMVFRSRALVPLARV